MPSRLPRNNVLLYSNFKKIFDQNKECDQTVTGHQDHEDDSKEKIFSPDIDTNNTKKADPETYKSSSTVQITDTVVSSVTDQERESGNRDLNAIKSDSVHGDKPVDTAVDDTESATRADRLKISAT